MRPARPTVRALPCSRASGQRTRSTILLKRPNYTNHSSIQDCADDCLGGCAALRPTRGPTSTAPNPSRASCSPASSSPTTESRPSSATFNPTLTRHAYPSRPSSASLLRPRRSMQPAASPTRVARRTSSASASPPRPPTACATSTTDYCSTSSKRRVHGGSRRVRWALTIIRCYGCLAIRIMIPCTRGSNRSGRTCMITS
mmetsp:Transcript_97013/g.277596  ORF Transcript_97013/g.277596 Transcript_97013/m.277596 type:complete len:200 (+) Transcript_97013:1540-2139(+)